MSLTPHCIILMLLFLQGLLPCLQAQSDGREHVPYWIRAIDMKDADYFQAIQSFEDYWKDKVMPEEDFEPAEDPEEVQGHRSEANAAQEEANALFFQIRRFRKWALINKSFVRPDGSLRPDDLWLKDAQGAGLSNRSVIRADWKPTGPNSSLIVPLEQVSRSGRMCQLKFHPLHPEVLYAISGSGGLFVSKDDGHTWNSTGTDGLPFGYQPASICIDHTDDQILYLGMGDANYGSQGHGVWKSTDGGATWFNSSGQMGDRLVYEILMAPQDHLVLTAATDNGIWKSVDAGVTWQLKQGLFTDAFLDMKARPGNAGILYACTFSRFYRSTDAGETWTQITAGIDVPSGGGHGMRLAVSDADPEVVYLGMMAQQGTVFKSADGGTSFQRVYQDTVTQSLVTINHLVDGASNGNYNFAMVADPDDADIVYFGTQTLCKSTDGGTTWSFLYPYLYVVHPDIHDLRFSPLHHGLFNLNDGGIALSMDGGTTWSQRNDGIVAAEIYNGGQSPIRKDMLYIGTQDNGALSYRRGLWYPDVQGDIFDRFWFDYHTPDRYYSDHGQSRGLESQKNYNMHFPLTVYGNRKMVFSPVDSNVVFLCQNEVWRTSNIRDAVPQWTRITLPLSGSSSDYIRDMAIAPDNPNELYVVYGNAKILYSKNALDAQPDFDTLDVPLPSTFPQTCIAISEVDPDLVYLAGWNQIFRSPDKGLHWTDITDNLPDANIYKIVHDGYSRDESLYILCGNRVYYRNDSLQAWVDYSQGLPMLAYISDLLIYNDGSRESLLRTISYGRGVFESPLYRLQPLPYADFTSDTTRVCTMDPVQYTNLSLDGTSWHWEFEGGMPAVYEGHTPPPVVYASSGSFRVSLTVTNPFGQDIMTREHYILVEHQFSIPFEEGFEGVFPPGHWLLTSGAGNNIQWRQAYLGGYAASERCAVFNDSYSNSIADMRLNVDLSESIGAELYFDVAYARRTGNVIFDSLAIFVSADCGVTQSVVYCKGGQELATMPDIENSISFDPGADGWRTDTVDLQMYDGTANLLVYFRGYGHAGEIMVIDNINVRGNALGLEEKPKDVSPFRVIPNPTKGTFRIQGKYIDDAFLTITNSTGDVVFRERVSKDDSSFQIEMADLARGVYVVTLSSGGLIHSEIVVVQ